jgi:hypothetical protein
LREEHRRGGEMFSKRSGGDPIPRCENLERGVPARAGTHQAEEGNRGEPRARSADRAGQAMSVLSVCRSGQEMVRKLEREAASPVEGRRVPTGSLDCHCHRLWSEAMVGYDHAKMDLREDDGLLFPCGRSLSERRGG